MYKSKKNQQGLTLVETMVVISLLAIVIYVGMLSFPVARDYLRQLSLTKQVNDFSIVVSGSCINGDCGNVTTQRVLDSGNLKEYHNAAGTAVLSISGVGVEFAPGDIGAGTNNGLSQTHENITQRVCNMAIKSMWQNTAIINVGGVAVKPDPDASLDEDLLNANCTPGMNQIEFITQAG